MELMRVAEITKHYGEVAALTDVGFVAKRGEVLGLIGPNGSGKTTLLECLAGLRPADTGSVFWDGAPLPAGRRKAALFYMPDGITPFAEQSVGSVLSFFGAVYGRPAACLDEVIEALSLSPVLRKPVGNLSKGYRRRLLMVCGLLTPHPLLMMDEPFDGFDLHQTREMMGLLRHVTERGRTLLLAIHQLIDAERMCDRFVLLAAGRVRGEGALAALRNRAGLADDAGLEEVFLALT